MAKRKKESIVVFEDWIKYARCLNDAEFRLMISAIFEYQKTQTQPQFTGMLEEVWNDIFDDVESNVSKKLRKRETMLRNAKRNPKHNTKPDIEPDTKPTIKLDTSGMVDGRWMMGDDDGREGDEKVMTSPPLTQSQWETQQIMKLEAMANGH